MTTHFIAAEIDLDTVDGELDASINAKLRERGEPLRWAVTEVSADTAKVEAVVLTTNDPAPSN